MTDKDTPKACPHCGSRGPFDSHGYHTRKITRKRVGVETEIKQRWFRFHCPDCGNVSAMLESETEETVTPTKP